jgi:ketosteroid isomerase-like protein
MHAIGRLHAKTWAVALALGVARAEEANHEDHEALRRLRDTFEQAAAQNDLDRLKPYLATNFSIVTFTDREFDDFEAFKAQWRKTRTAMLGDGGSYRVQLNPECSLLLGDIALCRGNSSNVIVNAKGRTFAFGAHWSVVCQKVDGQWKILRGHNSLDPFRNPMLKHAVKGMIFKTAVPAFVLGLALGGAVMFLVGRRSTAK